MKASQEIQERLEKLQNELLYILAKAGVIVLASLTLLWWLIRKIHTLVVFIPGMVIVAVLLLLVVQWGRAYFRLRKEYYHLENQFKLQLHDSTDNEEGDTPLIVFRRH